MFAFVLMASTVGADPSPQPFVVVNKCAPATFTVVNRTAPCSICAACACKPGTCPACPAAAKAAPAAKRGPCGCTSADTCLCGAACDCPDCPLWEGPRVPVRKVSAAPGGVDYGCFNCTACGNGCACFGGGYYCRDGACPVGSGRAIHVSPDGTVNELHADGVYRPIPGAPKQKPQAVQVSPAPAAPVQRYSPFAAPFTFGPAVCVPGKG